MKKRKKKHKPGCACDGPGTLEERLAALRRQEEQMLRDPGYFMHAVFDDPNLPFGVNVHTHGLEQFGHLDFQLILPLPPNASHYVLTKLAEEVKSGRKFEAGMTIPEFFDSKEPKMPVSFISAMECGREVLRVIIPDRKGCLDAAEMVDGYGLQYVDDSVSVN